MTPLPPASFLRARRQPRCSRCRQQVPSPGRTHQFPEPMMQTLMGGMVPARRGAARPWEQTARSAAAAAPAPQHLPAPPRARQRSAVAANQRADANERQGAAVAGGCAAAGTGVGRRRGALVPG